MGGEQPPATPPGNGRDLVVPRGIEVLVHKAAVDAQFRALLLERRAEAAGEIGLRLSPAEAAMLNGIPASQLEAVIASTKVSPGNRRAFLGKAAAVMLAALAVGSCDLGCPATLGSRPGRPRRRPSTPASKGIRPDRPKSGTRAAERAKTRR